MTNEKTAVDLLPCPFCGSKAIIEEFPSMVDQKWQVDCPNEHCLCSPSSNAWRTEKEAQDAWNTRATPPAVDQKREEALRDLPYIGTHGNWLFSSNKEVLAVWMIKHEQTIRAALSQPSIPPGYALVPVEPTEEMLTAAQETLCQMRSVTMFDDEVEIEKYKAMIAAAPKQEKSE